MMPDLTGAHEFFKRGSDSPPGGEVGFSLPGSGKDFCVFASNFSLGFQPPLKQWMLMLKYNHHCLPKGFNHRNWEKKHYVNGWWKPRVFFEALHWGEFLRFPHRIFVAAAIFVAPMFFAFAEGGFMNLHDEAVPCAMGEGLIELEVLSMSGECMLTLHVADSMLGRELWKMILDKVPSKPGLQLVVSHTSRLVLNESLQQQGLGGQHAQVSATYVPVNLHAAWRFAQECSVEDAEFSWTGIAEVTGANNETPALLHNLPRSLCTLKFADGFNQDLRHVRLPEGLRSVTFGRDFNQNLDNVTWPAGLQSLTFGENFNQNLDNVTWPEGLQSLTFEGDFNQNLDNVTWPAGLQSLTLGSIEGAFNQNLDKVTWPAGLQSLTFGENFNQNLDNVTWPVGLQSLNFGGDFNQNLENVT